MVKDKVTIRQEMRAWIGQLGSAEDVHDLFAKLNYPKEAIFGFPSKRKKSAFDLKKEENQKFKDIYSILSFDEKLSVFLVESSTLHPSFIRYVTKVFADRYIRFLLILTVNYSELVFVFPDYEKKRTGTHKLKITKLVLNKKEIHYTDVDTLANLYYRGDEASWRDVWKKWKDAFNVERVTLDFFEDYKKEFFRLRSALDRQGISRKNSHEFTLQFLNRVMFIYFISKKGWLKFSKFMAWFWKAYLEDRNKGNSSKDSFYKIWLSQIFFRAFNNRTSEVTGLPDSVKNILLDFPYLNGGLFSETDLDSLKIKISDDLFKQVFEFFEKFNFTIKEDMPLESEVAVDPQMLGYVYESLANVAEEIYDRNDMGIFYTPRVEVDFMCRRSLVEYLSKHLPDVPKDKFYTLVFDPLENKDKIEAYFQQEKLWNKLGNVLDNLSVIDPACGSGAFLVGMLNVLVGLYRIIYKYIEVDLTDFQLKKRVVGRSLYGVDVMPWAIHAAELRLWLQLVIETEFKKDELHRHALLPNLNMNLRIGDSLVQEIGGINLNLRSSNISEELKDQLNELKFEKQNYFNDVPTAKFKTKEEIIREETRIFIEIINERVELIKNKIKELKKPPKQITILESNTQKKLAEEEKQAKIDELIKERNDLKEVLKNLGDPGKKPFVWDIDFAEIFGDKNGFDIVIGNPPYVRQEMISPPNRIKAEVTSSDRKEYKEKLIKSIQSQFPIITQLDKKSDYYVYFYFHGLSLLNEIGTFCFITSNSWLDVGYGKDLQEFLLKYVPICAIYDNPKRSFAHADINTIIVLFGAPKIGKQRQSIFANTKKENWQCLNNLAKFVMFRKQFEEVLTAKNLIDIDNIRAEVKGVELIELIRNVVNSNEYRIFPLIQDDLLEDGWEYPEDYKGARFRIGNYMGNKWGGKYLRAPDIFYTILEKGIGKLTELNKIAKIRRGFTTGANDFFYLDEETRKKFKIEKEFLKPVIKSPRECKQAVINSSKLRFKVFICNKPKAELKGTNALEYIKYGESKTVEVKSGGDKGKKVKGYHRLETVKNRVLWYGLLVKGYPTAVWVKAINENHGQSILMGDCFVDQRLYSLYFPKEISSEIQVVVLNNSIFYLFKELQGRVNLGEGVLDTAVFEANKCIIIKPSCIKKGKTNIEAMKFLSVFEELNINSAKPIREQEPNPLPDRAELDKIVFDELGLTEEERKEVYWAVCELVKQRLEKAKSLKT